MHFCRCYWAPPHWEGGFKAPVLLGPRPLRRAIESGLHPDPSTPTYRVSWACGHVPALRVLHPARLPIRAPPDGPVCGSQAASVEQRNLWWVTDVLLL